MHTPSCRSSNGRSCGPEVQTTSSTRQPVPQAKRREVSAMTQISNFSQAREPRQHLGNGNGPATCEEEQTMIASSFIDALASNGPAADRADKMKLYGWLIGRWTMDAIVHLDDGGRHQGRGEIYF